MTYSKIAEEVAISNERMEQLETNILQTEDKLRKLTGKKSVVVSTSVATVMTFLATLGIHTLGVASVTLALSNPVGWGCAAVMAVIVGGITLTHVLLKNKELSHLLSILTTSMAQYRHDFNQLLLDTQRQNEETFKALENKQKDQAKTLCTKMTEMDQSLRDMHDKMLAEITQRLEKKKEVEMLDILVESEQRGLLKEQRSRELVQCPVCRNEEKNVRLPCGHTLCDKCSAKVDCCPFCYGDSQPCSKIYLQ